MITYNDILAATPNVLKRLRELAPLPAHGTVAGQAVASLFYEELNIGVSGPINDVDIFVSLTLPPEQRGVVHTGNHKGMKNNRTASNITSMVVDTDNYSHVKFICARSNVTIFRTYQHGLRNFTLIKHKGVGDNGEQTIDVSQDIVNGFDLNLVGVGIHLDSGKAVVSADFMAFLNHKTIQVLTCNTPTHTLIRLAKKVHSGEIVGANCNYDEQRSMLETYLTLVERNANLLVYNGGTVLAIGQKYRSIAHTYAQHLPPLKRNSVLYTFNPQSLRAEPAITAIEQLMHTNGSTGDNANFLVAYTFVANFPTVYKLAHQPNTQRWDMLNAAWNSTTDVNDAVRLNNMSIALFNRPLIDPALGLADLDAATFFFDHNMDQQQRAHATELYQNFSASEKIIFHHHFDNIRYVHEFFDNTNAYTDEFLLRDGLVGLAKISANISAPEAHALVDKMFKLLDGNEQYTARMVNHLISEPFITQSPNLFMHYENTHNFLQKLLKIDNIDIEQLTPKHQFVVALAYFNGVWDERWNDDLQFPCALEDFFVEGHWFYQTVGNWGAHAQHIDFVHKGLNILNESQLKNDNGIVLRNILVPQHYDVVRNRLMQIEDQTALLNTLSSVSQYLEQRFGGTKQEDPSLTALWSKLILDLSTVELGATKHKRKM